MNQIKTKNPLFSFRETFDPSSQQSDDLLPRRLIPAFLFSLPFFSLFFEAAEKPYLFYPIHFTRPHSRQINSDLRTGGSFLFLD